MAMRSAEIAARSGVSVAALIAAALIAHPAAAQDAAAATAPADAPTKAVAASDKALSTTAANGDIIVTATRRGESINKIGASITAIGAGQIGAGGITNVQSLATAVPDLSVGDQFGVNRIFIRGIGLTSIDLGADGGVAFLQDGAIISRPAAQLSGFYDIARVEVLRGPQGTLYGRGATAGAINLITARPTNTSEGYLDLTYGNYNQVVAEGAVSGPIVKDRLMVRISGKYDSHDGFGRNLFTGKPVDDRDAWAIRGSLLWKMTGRLELEVTGEHFYEHDNNYAFHYFGPTVAPENALGSILGGDTIITYSQKQGIPLNLRNIYSDQDAVNRRHGNNVTATLSWSDGGLTLRSISSFHDFVRFNRDDLDVSNVWLFGQNNYREKSETVSQEFVATYKAGRWDLLGGALYFHENLSGFVKVPLVNLGILFGLPANSFDSFNYLQQGTVETDAYGVYLQAGYNFTDKLKFTLGGRYSYERRHGTGSFQFLSFVPTDKAKSWDAFTPTIGINYQVTPETLLYASVTRGFKSGVINLGSQNPVIDPEYAWGYEVGIKSHTFDNRLGGSIAGFYIDYSNLQVGFVGADSVVTTVNAAAARNYGVEVEMHARPVPKLQLSAFATYLNAKYTKFTNGYYGAGFAIVDLHGKTLDNAPEFSARAEADYDLWEGHQGKLNLRADINWQDRVYFTEFNNADATQGPFAMIDAGLRFTTRKGWTVDAWGRNLTDKFVISNNIITAPLFNSVRVGSIAPPRTFGVTLGLKY